MKFERKILKFINLIKIPKIIKDRNQKQNLKPWFYTIVQNLSPSSLSSLQR